MSEDNILQAIYDDDRRKLKELFDADKMLGMRPISRAILFRGKILHWIYVGDSVLHVAAAGHRVEIVRLLLSAGADANVRGKHRLSTPLHYAADGHVNAVACNPTRQVNTIICLLDAGADINAQDKNGATPLHRAVRTRSAAAVRCLLKSGCEPSLKNKPGSTPFHLAVQNTGKSGSGSDQAKTAQREIIEEFLSRGISVRLKDGKGKSVLDCAKSEWIREMLRG